MVDIATDIDSPAVEAVKAVFDGWTANVAAAADTRQLIDRLTATVVCAEVLVVGLVKIIETAAHRPDGDVTVPILAALDAARRAT